MQVSRLSSSHGHVTCSNSWLRTVSLCVSDAGMVCSTAAVDFEPTVWSGATNGSRMWIDFLKVFLKQEPRFCLDTGLMYLKRHWSTVPQRDGDNCTPLACLVMLPRFIHLFVPVHSMWSRKGGSYAWYISPLPSVGCTLQLNKQRN